jgi:hypothetical protein
VILTVVTGVDYLVKGYRMSRPKRV